MKRILLTIAAVGALMVVACQSESKKAEVEATDFKTKIENCTNTDSIKIYVEQAVAYANKLAAEGKTAEATDYLADIKATVSKKAPDLTTYFDNAQNAVDTLSTKVADKTKEVKDSVVSKVADAKAKLDKAASDTKDAAKDKVDAAKDKASKAVDEAASSVKSALGK